MTTAAERARAHAGWGIPGRRTATLARWAEYEQLLDAAVAHRYALVSLEDWLAGAGPPEQALLLRHDVDQRAGAALPMAAIEAARGAASTWYFRWRTAEPRVISSVRARGGAVGLHYETLSRRALEEGLTKEQITPALIDACRAELRREIAIFVDRFGAIQSICPHGDTRVPHAANSLLLNGARPEDFGVRWDGYWSPRARPLGYWLTDRSPVAGRWKDGVDPHGLFAAGVGPILCLTHPNNWCSGLGLWVSRLRLAGRRTPDAPRA
jgi:hypothetical protein